MWKNLEGFNKAVDASFFLYVCVCVCVCVCEADWALDTQGINKRRKSTNA